jgi:hypothetical protein
VLIKFVKELSISSYTKSYPESMMPVCQLLNINIKGAMKRMGMIELTMGKYYHKD